MQPKHALVLGVLVLGGLFVPVGTGQPAAATTRAPVRSLDLSQFSDARPARPLRLLFIHHSCGGQLLADRGPDVDRGGCIYTSSPNGGGLKTMLTSQGYEVHEASYGSAVGQNTDLFDWLPKFRDRMPAVLAVDENDRPRTDGLQNEIVVFKSCFTQSDYVGEGAPPGDPSGPALTVWNAKATLAALLPELAKQPSVLFVYMTAPPLAPPPPHEPLWKAGARLLLGRGSAGAKLAQKGAWAREVDEWVVSPDGWLKGYPRTNVVVFDYYDVLTEGGRSDLSRFASEGGADSHPSSEGNARAAAAFTPLLNRAVRRAGLAP